MPDLDDRSFASYLAAMQGLANGHELERRGDVVTRPGLWAVDRSYDTFMNKGRFERPTAEYASGLTVHSGGTTLLVLDPLLLSRWTGPEGGAPTVTWNGQTLKIVLQPASGTTAEPEYLVLLQVDAARAPKVQHLPLDSALEDGTATVTSEKHFAGGTLRLVDVRDSAVGIQLNPTAVPEGDAGAMAEGEFGDGELAAAIDLQPAVILVDGENMAYAAPEHWWRQHAGSVANWISRSYCDSAQPVVRHNRLCRYEHYEQGTQGTISGWVVAGATDHHLVAVLSQALTSKGFTRLNNYGPQHPGWNKQTAKDNCDEVLRRAYEDLLVANTTLQTTQLVLLNGDGAPSEKGPEVPSQNGPVHVNCFVWAAHEHAQHCTELQDGEQSDQGNCHWDAISKPVVAVPFDKFNGCSIEWKDGSRKGGAKEVPVNWGARRTDYVERGRDLLDRVFGASGHQARLSAPTQARLAQFLKQYGDDRRGLDQQGLLDSYNAGDGVRFKGRWMKLPDSIDGWAKSTSIPEDSLGGEFGLCAKAVLGALREESPSYLCGQSLYEDLKEQLQPGWAKPAVAIAVACLALGVREQALEANGGAQDRD